MSHEPTDVPGSGSRRQSRSISAHNSRPSAPNPLPKRFGRLFQPHEVYVASQDSHQLPQSVEIDGGGQADGREIEVAFGCGVAGSDRAEDLDRGRTALTEDLSRHREVLLQRGPAVGRAGGASRSAASEKSDRVNYTHDPWFLYAEGYRRGAEILVERAAATRGELDALVYPIVFLYRQYAELALKILVRDAGILIDDPEAPINTHDLARLWARVETLLSAAFPDEATNRNCPRRRAPTRRLPFPPRALPRGGLNGRRDLRDELLIPES